MVCTGAVRGGDVMRRYTSLIITAFIAVMMAAIGSGYLAGHADTMDANNPVLSVRAYTTIPAEQAEVLAAEYQKEYNRRVEFIPMAEDDRLETLRGNSTPKADMVVADRETMEALAVEGRFSSYVSEHSDQVPETLKDPEGLWVGVWYDPIVISINNDYMASLKRVPRSWADLAAMPTARISMTDFIASGASSNFLFSLSNQYGEETAFQILSTIHPKVVQYSKYLSTPVRMAGMGESDIAISVCSETMRYVRDGYPLTVIYPEDGTSYILIGTGILQGAENETAAKQFADWLQGDEAQIVQQKNGFFFIPSNPATMAYKSFAGKNIALFRKRPILGSSERQRMLDKWVKEIRFK